MSMATPTHFREALAQILRRQTSTSMSRLLCALALLTSLCATLWSATVTGTVQSSQAIGTTTSVRFVPLSNPQVREGIVITSDVQTITATNGTFSVTLHPGDYEVLVGGKDSFQIAVPSGDATYNIQSLITTGLTYTYSALPTRWSLSPATDTALGGVVLAQAVGDVSWTVPTLSYLTNYSATNVFGGTVLNLAALDNLVGSSQAIAVLGHTTAGDGGGGTFTWASANTATDDDGVSVYQPASWTSAGRWIRVVNGEHPRPEWGGGFPDGVMTGSTQLGYSVDGTDCRSAINACFTAYGECWLGPGIYCVSRWTGKLGEGTDPFTLKLIGSGKEGGHDGGKGTTLALLDGAVAHTSLLPWGTYYPDVMFFAGNYSTGCRVEDIYFYANGWNRTVTGKAGYYQAGSQPIFIVGDSQVVRSCAFSGLSAYSGSTGGARTADLPEVFAVNLSQLPLASAWIYSSEWVDVPAPIVEDCEWIGPIAPQRDEDDFGSTASPEITCLLVNGMASGQVSATGNITAGDTNLVATTAFFEAWMEGWWMYVGDERVEIASVESSTNAWTSAPVVSSHASAVLRTKKHTRRWFDSPRITGNLFQDLQLYRSNDAYKNIRSIHLITVGDSKDAVITGNISSSCDGPLFYLDNGVLYGAEIAFNTVNRSLNFFNAYMAQRALASDTSTGAAKGWWADWAVHDNKATVGYEAKDRASTVYIDKDGTLTYSTYLNGVDAFVLSINSDNPEQAIVDSLFTATATVKPQTHAMERIRVVYNDIVAYGYYRRVLSSSIWSGTYSAYNSPFFDGNILDEFLWVPAESGGPRWNGVDSRTLAESYYYTGQLYWGRNPNLQGLAVPLNIVYPAESAGVHWPPQDESAPLGWSADGVAEISWSTASSAGSAVRPDADGLVWYASRETWRATNTVAGNNLNINWTAGADYSCKLVLPKARARGYTAGLDEVMTGHTFRVHNASGNADALGLYYTTDNTNVTFICNVPRTKTVEVLVRHGATPDFGISGMARPYVMADAGDADATLTSLGYPVVVLPFATTLTSNRAVTLPATGMVNGDIIRIVRTGLGSYTLAIGALKTIPSATAAAVEVIYDSTIGAWRLLGYQTL